MILEKICRDKIDFLEVKKRKMPMEYLKGNIIDFSNSDNFQKALLEEGLTVIGEAKKASPSKGIIRADFDIKEIIKNYDKGEVRAISVLTEENYFKGSLANIKIAKKLTNKPILRKDFIMDIYELYESKFYLADAVLLIAAVLKDRLLEFNLKAKELGIETLIEVHDEKELELALKAEGKIIGVNNRNLNDFSVDIKNTERLKSYIPKDRIVVSESGISSKEDIEYMKSINIDAVLIGEYFMRGNKL
ncbi:MAG: indole-3-glycerol phosphate synthase TrpC [Sarcina sp.]